MRIESDYTEERKELFEDMTIDDVVREICRDQKENPHQVVTALSQLERMGRRSEDSKEVPVKCTICGARMSPITTDLPFKLSEERIVILKQLPVLQCGACREYLIEDAVMARIDAMLAPSLW